MQLTCPVLATTRRPVYPLWPYTIASDDSCSFGKTNDCPPRHSSDEPGVRPDEPVLWPDRVRTGTPSARGGPLSCRWYTGRQYPVAGCTPVSVPPRQFPDWLTGRQCPGWLCPDQSRAIRGSTGSVPRAAHRPSVPMPALSAGPASRAFRVVTAGDLTLTISESLRARPLLTSESLQATPTWARCNSADDGRVAARD
jgi:hypothetical protein